MKSILMKVIPFLFVFYGCKKQEGGGGQAKIKGKIFSVDYINKDSPVLDTIKAVDEDVYIIYGDDEQVSDKVVTNQDGTYCFDYLRKGDYTILVYTRDPEKGDVKFPVEKKVSISGRKDEVDVEDIYLYLSDKGNCSLTGKIYAIDFADDYAIKPDTFLVAEEDVYLTETGSDAILYKTSTSQNGAFQFNYLRHLKYSVVVYTNNPATGGDKAAVVKDVAIGEQERSAAIEDIYIYKPDVGYATISGKILCNNYSAEMLPKTPVDLFYIGGEDVYLQKAGSNQIIDRVKTGEGGVYQFSKLSTGTYYVYVFSKNPIPIYNGATFKYSSELKTYFRRF